MLVILIVLLVFVVVLAISVAAVLVAEGTPPKAKQKRKPKRKRTHRPPAHRVYSYTDSDQWEQDEEDGYHSPLGLVDDPADEWIEYAIMEDFFDDQ